MNKDNVFCDSKIVILDLNFLEIARYSLDDFLYTKKLILELTANQNVIFITDNAYFLACKVIDSIGVKSGYLISDVGAVITSIANKKTIDEGLLDTETIIKICRKCVWSNLHFSIITDERKYPFSMSDWIIKKYRSDLSHLYEYQKYTISSSDEIDKIVKGLKVRGIEIYFLEKEHDQRREKMLKFISIFKSFVDYSINMSSMYVIPKEKTKLSAVMKVIEKIDPVLKIEKDGIYCAVGQCDSDIVSRTYLSAVTKEVKDHEDSKNLIAIENADIISWKDKSWINWFYENEHLWHGYQDIKLREVLEKYKNYFVSRSDLLSIESGQTNNLYLLEKEISNTAFSNRINKISLDKEKIKISFWPQQIPQLNTLIKKNQIFKIIR